ncbi:hypothetical protein V1227_06485 [Lentzea sp. DG1S-22]|uniref:hypothetical protein n=1 Tax=Lentzea sp. DG1S-22 TaxID=3108822 RepID=UPI002E7AA371|nr:hypothetical protein [Lentzea sp. DG1S-22]WVH82400.1 hypothetical protein V1227_06485 [Lentzea sp. DG1S-22]
MDDTITVERVGHALLVGVPGADGDAAELAASLAPERHRTAVVVGASANDAVARLDPWVVADLDEVVSGSLRLMGPRLGAVGPRGEVPPARLLADRLGVEVVAPEDELMTLPQGNVFVPGGWVSYRPGTTGRRSGPRHPAPWWQAMLPRDAGEQIPLGLWVRAPRTAPRADDPVHGRVPDTERLTVVVGAPGEPAPDVAAVAEVFRALPGEARDRAVLVCYGCDLAQELADELDQPVRALHGVPWENGVVRLDSDGEPTWRPFALESMYLPGAPPVLDRWVAPVPTMTMIAPAAYRLVDGWRLDVVPRGLLARPDDLAVDPSWVGRTGPTPDLVVASAQEVPPHVVTALEGLVADLPDDTRSRLRTVPTSTFAALAVSTLPRPESTGLRGAAVVVTPDGRILPSSPVLASPGPARFTKPLRTNAEPSARRVPRRAPDRAVAPVEVVGTDAVVGVPEPDRMEPVPPVGAAVSTPPAPVRPAAARGRERTAEAGADRPSPRPTVAAVPQAPAQPPEPARPSVPERTAAQPAPSPGRMEPAERPLPDLTSTTAAVLPASVSSLVAPPSPRQVWPALAEPGPAGAPEPAEPSALPVEADEPGAGDTGEQAGTVAPESTSDEQAAAPEPKRRIIVPPGTPSTPAHRAGMRTSLGSRYDIASRAVARLLAERPGLRAPGTDTGTLAAELAAVRIFAMDPDGDYDLGFHTCLAAGLRRLPTTRGVVVRGVPSFNLDVGSELTLVEPLLAGAAKPRRRVRGVEALIWSTTARRLDGLLEGDQAHDVLLPAHTRLTVLERTADRVLLGEQGTNGAQALARLAAAAGEPMTSDDVARWFGDLL